MSSFEFVSVLLSIVVSLALAHLLTAVARMLQAKDLKFSFLLAGWIGIALFDCIDFWFSLWAARDTQVWSLGYILLWLAAATSIYLFAWLVAPEGKLDGVDLRAYHYANRRKFLPLCAAYLICGFFINATVAQFSDLVSIVAIVYYLPIIAAWIWPNTCVQFGAVIALWALLLQYAAQFLEIL